jgi:hypothetical protein
MRRSWMHFVWAYRTERFFGAGVWESVRFAIEMVREGRRSNRS